MYLVENLRFGFLFKYFPQHLVFRNNSGDSPNSAFAV